ncbi:alpha-2-macroglobulin family protein [Mangrovitalea sediminis]|uniref:alpha-2-macroglobulin family protein n=1 Tax=Mangrovitalea sediminis TaxID=1982043 RepID=UPI000BE57382|nr:alpha-2-macroglobulin [Mangrovitalea sediminis]
MNRVRYSAPLICLISCMLLLLQGCSDDKRHQAKTAPPGSPTVPFTVIKASEQSYQSAPALSLLFSQPLTAGTSYDDHLHVSTDQGPVKGAWVLSKDQHSLFFPNVTPETTYRISVDAGLRSAFDKPLPQAGQWQVKTRAVMPVASFASNGLLLPKDLSQGLPVVTVNVPSVNIEFFRIRDDQIAKTAYSLTQSGDASLWQLNDAIQNRADLVFSGRYDLNSPANKRQTVHIPIRDNDKLNKPGLYFAVMRQPGDYSHIQSTYFFVSDIGLQMRLYDHATVIVASSLKTGQGLAGVKVAVDDNHGNELASGNTGADGLFKLDYRLNKFTLLRAQKDQDVTFLPLTGPALDLSSFQLGSRRETASTVFLDSPRDLYRAGEKVTVSGLLRDQDGSPLLSRPLYARLLNADQQAVKVFTWQPDDATGIVNYYQTQFTLGDDAPSGQWHLEVRTNPGSRAPLASFDFQVQDFMPERMKLALKATPGIMSPAQEMQVQVAGSYLYGAPASGNRLSATLTVTADRQPIDTRPDFEFGDLADAHYQDNIPLDDQTLDDKGDTTLAVSSHWQNIHSPLQLHLIANLFESGGRPVTRDLTRQVWPADALIGVKLLRGDDGYIAPGNVRLQLIKAHPDGSLVADRQVQVKLFKIDRSYYWAYSANQGWHYQYSENTYPLDQQDASLGTQEPTTLTFPLQWGEYRLEATDPQTGLITSTRFRVGWWSWNQQAASAQPDKVTLRLDKPGYKGGDKAKLTIKPPHAGNALVMVEDSDGLLWSKRLDVPAKGTDIVIPVDPTWKRHDLYISTVVFRPGTAQDKVTPNRAIGLIPLPLDRRDRTLNVHLDAPDVTKPLQQVGIKVHVDNAGDQPTYVTLSAVDVGILSLTDFKTPDPAKTFFGQRRYVTDTYDIYGKVIELVDGPMAKLRYGGDADVTRGGQRARAHLKFLTLFSGPVKLDAQGNATVPLDLPDFNGQVRLMAMAFSTDRFGSSDRKMTIRAPLVVQLSKPRFLAGGDHSTLALDLANLSGKPQNLHVHLSVTPPLHLQDGERELTLADGDRKVLRFPVSADSVLATADIRMQVDSATEHLDKQWKLDVRPPYPGITRHWLKIEEPGTPLNLGPELVKGLVPATVESFLTVSAQPPLNIAQYLHGLLTYPYGCLEQTTSAAYPLLFADSSVQQRFGLTPMTDKARFSRIDNAIARIAKMQKPTGGFGLWDANSPEEPWLTPYATDFLLDARDQGVNVPDAMLSQALDRLQQYLQRDANRNLLQAYRRYADYLDFASDAYAAYVLARVNRVPLGMLRTLYQHRDEMHSGLPLLQLGIALHLQGDDQLAGDAFKKALTQLRKPRTDGYYGDYGSVIRDRAQALYLIHRYKLEIPHSDDLIAGLFDALHDDRWLSTQERNALFMAGLSLTDTQTFSADLRLGEQSKVLDDSPRYVAHPTADDLAKGLSLISRSKKRIYLSLAVGGYPATPPKADFAPLKIRRTFYTLDGRPLGDRTVKSGDLLLAHITIDSDRYIPDALVVDLLPAGLEPENQALAHTVKLDQLSINGTSLSSLIENSQPSHEEYRDDRYVAAVSLDKYGTTHLIYLVRAVTPGTYKVPPPQVESMYRPALRGRGDIRSDLVVEP